VDKYKKNKDLFMKTFNLESSLSITNMVLFDPNGKLKKYTTVEEIMQTFYDLRLKFYQIRKDYMISVIKKDVALLSNKARFIKLIIDDVLVIRKKKRNVIVNELYDLKFDTQSAIDRIRLKSKSEEDAEIELINQNLQNEEEKKEEENEVKEKGQIKAKVPWKEYDYLLSMNFWNITYEKVEELLKQKEIKEKELEELKKTPIETIWINDLDNFIEELDKYEAQEEEDRLVAEKLNKNKDGKIGKKKRKKKNDKDKNNKSKLKITNGNDSDTSEIPTGTKKRGRKKNDTEINKTNTSTNIKKTKNKKVITEDSEEEKDESSRFNTNIKASKGKDSNTNNDSSTDNKSTFKAPLMERLKKKNAKIDEISSFKLTNFGKKAKRTGLVDLSDFDLDFNDKEQMI
jgi:DNA topoisomerase-2